MFECLSDDVLTRGARGKRQLMVKKMRSTHRAGAPGPQRLAVDLWLNAAGWPIATDAIGTAGDTLRLVTHCIATDF